MIIIYIIIFAIIVTSVIFYFSQRSEEVQNHVNVQEKEIITENKPIVDKPIVDVHEIILRNCEYIPKINGKYLHTDFPSYKYSLIDYVKYCEKFESEKEGIKAIKDYYIYKDVEEIVYETHIKNCDVLYYPISKVFFPRVNKKFIINSYFSLYKEYKFDIKPMYGIYFNSMEETENFLETYNNSLGFNDVIIKVDINL